MAQRKRAGLITRRSLDRNELQLISISFFAFFPCHLIRVCLLSHLHPFLVPHMFSLLPYSHAILLPNNLPWSLQVFSSALRLFWLLWFCFPNFTPRLFQFSNAHCRASGFSRARGHLPMHEQQFVILYASSVLPGHNLIPNDHSLFHKPLWNHPTSLLLFTLAFASKTR